MTDLILKVLQGRASTAERQELQAWRASSPDHETRYQEVARVWRLTADGDVEVDEGRWPDPWKVARRATIRSTPATPSRRSDPSRTGSWPKRVFAGTAAALAIALGTWQFGLRQEPALLTSGSEVRTDAGESTTVHLADGSFVRLGPGSRLRFDPVGDGRRVRLDGRAFFAVAHDDRPFTVHTLRGEAVVLGTRFDLDTRDDDLTLLVVEGRVALSADGQRVEVGDGEMTRTSAGAALDTRKVDDVFAHLEWLGRALLFQGTPLTDVVRQIERVYGAEVAIDDASLGTRTLTASFTSQSFDDVMNAVCEVLSLTCVIEGDRARIAEGSPTVSMQIAPQERR